MFFFKEPMSSWQAPLFIAGTGGSGTRVFTLLARDLGYFMGNNVNDAHDAMDMAAFNEAWRVRMLPGQPPLTPGELKKRDSGLEKALRSHRKGIPGPGALWGYKHPRDIFLLPFLVEKFPALKFLHVVRDGLDMAFSDNQLQLRDFGPAWLTADEQQLPVPVRSALLWNRINTTAADLGEGKLGANYLWMRFEDLCLTPEPGLARLEAFTGRSFGDARAAALGRVQPPSSLKRGQRQEPEITQAVAAACAPGRRRFGYAA